MGEQTSGSHQVVTTEGVQEIVGSGGMWANNEQPKRGSQLVGELARAQSTTRRRTLETTHVGGKGEKGWV